MIQQAPELAAWREIKLAKSIKSRIATSKANLDEGMDSTKAGSSLVPGAPATTHNHKLCSDLNMLVADFKLSTPRLNQVTRPNFQARHKWIIAAGVSDWGQQQCGAAALLKINLTPDCKEFYCQHPIKFLLLLRDLAVFYVSPWGFCLLLVFFLTSPLKICLVSLASAALQPTSDPTSWASVQATPGCQHRPCGLSAGLTVPFSQAGQFSQGRMEDFSRGGDAVNISFSQV